MRRRLRRSGGGLAAVGVMSVLIGLIGLIGVSALPVRSAEANGGGTTAVLALGDSLAAGVGASDPERTGYPALIRDRVAVLTGLEVELINLAAPGETTDSLIAAGQLEAAVAVLASRDDVGLVTINIGGNDAFGLVSVCAGGLTPECGEATVLTFEAVGANLAETILRLRAAAVPGTPIVVGTYANALRNSGCEFNAAAGLADVLLDGSTAAGVAVGLNDVIRGVALATGVAVADAFFALRDPDLFLADCLHYNDAGYAAYAARFNAVYRLGPTGLPSTGSGGLVWKGGSGLMLLLALVMVGASAGVGVVVIRARGGRGA